MVDDWTLLDKLAKADAADIQAVCSALARILRVHYHEVGMLCIRGKSLEFVFPAELKAAGRIPLSSSAVAACTANTKQPEVFNEFTKVTHHSVFELIPLGSGSRADLNPDQIQKLISVPVVDSNGKVLGVIQISRKGATRGAAGDDFVESDLRDLEAAARRLVPLFERL